MRPAACLPGGDCLVRRACLCPARRPLDSRRERCGREAACDRHFLRPDPLGLGRPVCAMMGEPVALETAWRWIEGNALASRCGKRRSRGGPRAHSAWNHPSRPRMCRRPHARPRTAMPYGPKRRSGPRPTIRSPARSQRRSTADCRAAWSLGSAPGSRCRSGRMRSCLATPSEPEGDGRISVLAGVAEGAGVDDGGLRAARRRAALAGRAARTSARGRYRPPGRGRNPARGGDQTATYARF